VVVEPTKPGVRGEDAARGGASIVTNRKSPDEAGAAPGRDLLAIAAERCLSHECREESRMLGSKRRRAVVALASWSVALLAAASARADEPTGDPKGGKAVFETSCVLCHGLAGRATGPAP